MKAIFTAAVSAVFFISSAAFAAPVNINQASAGEIAEALSGVGMSKAQAIVEFRKKNGSFTKASDIVQVKGIGQSTYEKNKGDILVK